MSVRRVVVVAALTLTATLVPALSAHAAGAVGKPTIATISPSSGSFKGGTRVKITGANFRKIRYVEFADAPSTHRTVSSDGRSMTVTAPPNDVGWASVQIITASGEVTRTQGFLYEPPATIDPPHDSPVSLSCPAGHCYGLDRYDNFYDAGPGTGRWTGHGPPEHNITAETQKTACASRPAHDSCASVSCPRPAYCAGVDDLGHPLIWTRGVWKVFKALPPGGVSRNPFWFSRLVSCGSAGFCMVMDEFGDYATWNGRNWSALKTITGRTITKASQVDDTVTRIDTLSCAGTACLLIDDKAAKRKYSAGHSSNASVLVPQSDPYDILYFNQVSCANLSPTGTELSCVAGVVNDHYTYFVRYAGGHWLTAQEQRTPHSAMGSVSCGRNGRCIAIRADGATFEYGDSTAPNDANGWTGPIVMPGVEPGQLLASSCQATNSCTATFSPGMATTFDLASRTWSTPRRIVVARKGLSAVGCSLGGSGARFCLAGDVGPFVVDYVGGTWRKPVQKLHRRRPHRLGLLRRRTSLLSGDLERRAVGGRLERHPDGRRHAVGRLRRGQLLVGDGLLRGIGEQPLPVERHQLVRTDRSRRPRDQRGRRRRLRGGPLVLSRGHARRSLVRHQQRHDDDRTDRMGVPSGQEVTADSCQSLTRCVAVSEHLYSYTAGAGWTAKGRVGSGYRANDVACAPSSSTTHCVVVGYDNAAQSWTQLDPVDRQTPHPLLRPGPARRHVPRRDGLLAGDSVGDLRSYP